MHLPRLLMTTALASTLAGCVDNYGSLAIMGAAVADEDCVAEESKVVTEGVLDLDVERDAAHQPPGYMLFPIIANNLKQVGQAGGPEPNIVYLQGAHIKLTLPVDWTLTGSGCNAEAFDVFGSMSIQPTQTGTLPLEVIQPCQAAQMRARLQDNQYSFVFVDVQVYGKDGAKSDTFTFPVKVCRGCLRRGIQGFYSVCDYPAVCNCSDITSVNPAKGWACNPGQDQGPVLCCLAENGTSLICPAPDGSTATQ